MPRQHDHGFFLKRVLLLALLSVPFLALSHQQLQASPTILLALVIHICKFQHHLKRNNNKEYVKNSSPKNNNTHDGNGCERTAIDNSSTTWLPWMAMNPLTVVVVKYMPLSFAAQHTASSSPTVRAALWWKSFIQFFRRLTFGRIHTHPARTLGCATENNSHLQDSKELALNSSPDNYIYRFRPGSIITVSIDEGKFSPRTLAHLQCALECTLSTLNLLNLGINFRYISAKDNPHLRGLVELCYVGDATSARPTGTVWAQSNFPDPCQRQYTMNIYSATFEDNYLSVTPNILQHEFAHLLSLRHHPAAPMYSHERGQVLFPAGDNNTNSIMGAWTHPGELFIRDSDIEYLRKFYKMEAGDVIEGSRIFDVLVP